ncbi:MAG: hypothetical protein H0Z39_07070 [Peptococcaceae bacterium]|nr:hypothetical protein [Peptococcaceae bacterium]
MFDQLSKFCMDKYVKPIKDGDHWLGLFWLGLWFLGLFFMLVCILWLLCIPYQYLFVGAEEGFKLIHALLITLGWGVAVLAAAVLFSIAVITWEDFVANKRNGARREHPLTLKELSTCMLDFERWCR